MTPLNPITGALAQTPHAQRLQSEERSRQIRQGVKTQRGARPGDDPVDHFVESTNRVEPVPAELPPRQQRQRKRGKESPLPPDQTTIDVTA